jgi:hypothetical protein
MAKPVTLPTVFATLAAPTQSLALFDGNYSPLTAAINDIPTYGNYFTDTGAVNALVVTVTPLTFGLTSGTWIDVLVANTNTTTTPTLNVGGSGAKTIVDHTGGALLAGALIAGGVYHFMYDGSNYRCLTPTIDSGSFTGTFSGTGYASLTTTVRWSRNGNAVTFDIAAFTGTSNSTSLQMTGIPAALAPARNQLFPVPDGLATDNSVVLTVSGGHAVTVGFSGGGTALTFFKDGNSTNWTASGTKACGLLTFTYNLA